MKEYARCGQIVKLNNGLQRVIFFKFDIVIVNKVSGMHALPVNVKDIITGHTVEWERLEFKAGWNPLSTLHSYFMVRQPVHSA